MLYPFSGKGDALAGADQFAYVLVGLVWIKNLDPAMCAESCGGAEYDVIAAPTAREADRQSASEIGAESFLDARELGRRILAGAVRVKV
jgi:hypothetical protein